MGAVCSHRVEWKYLGGVVWQDFGLVEEDVADAILAAGDAKADFVVAAAAEFEAGADGELVEPGSHSVVIEDPG